jgi:uncharacterized phage protein (TIGR01671 family)
MREIKFRGKALEGEWVYGAFIPDATEPTHGEMVTWGFIRRYNVTDETMETIEVERKTVGQDTGLKDKNGREIYEGDIVYAECCEKYLEVYWNDIGCGGWWFAEKKDGYRLPVGSVDLDWLEVKGNIHDNPELLEGDEGE